MKPMEGDYRPEDLREKQAELKVFKDMDREAVELVGEEFHGLVSEETLTKMRGLPSEFKTHEDLAKAYAEQTGQPPPEGLEGFSKGLEAPAQICSDHHQGINETIIHERIHQASSPDGAARLGEHLQEGVTQALTEKAQEGVSFGNFYPGETEVAREMIEKDGAAAVEKLYFQNDAGELKAALGGEAEHEARLEDFKKREVTKLEDSGGHKS